MALSRSVGNLGVLEIAAAAILVLLAALTRAKGQTECIPDPTLERMDAIIADKMSAIPPLIERAQEAINRKTELSSDRSQSFGLSLLGAAFSNWFGGALEHDYTPSHGFGGAEGLRDQAHLFFFRNGVGDVLVNFLTHEGEGAEGEDREACMDASGFRVLMTDLDMMTPDGTPTMGRGGPRTCIGGPTANVSPIELELRIRTQFSCILGFEGTLVEAADLDFALGDLAAAVAVRHAAQEGILAAERAEEELALLEEEEEEVEYVDAEEEA